MNEKINLPYTSAFILAMNLLLQHEGANFVNDPSDSGGMTKFGITAESYEHHFGKPATLASMKALSLEDAYEFYWVEYWAELNLEGLNDKLAVLIFDQAVNCGTTAVTKRLQNMLQVNVDGKLGPATMAKLMSADATSFGLDFIYATALSYVRSAQVNPKNQKFMDGWINRTFSLLYFLLDTEKPEPEEV